MSGSLKKDGGGADRVILAALLSALSILGVGWFLMRESESPSRPLVFPPVSAAGRATYLVSGFAEPSSSVSVKANELPEVTTQADGGGHFQVELALPKADEYQVTARAKNARGVAGPPSLPVTFAHADKAAAPPFSRNVVVTASFRRVSVYVAVTLPSDDERAGELIKGADFGKFLTGVFEDEETGDEFEVSGKVLPDFFKGVKPQLSVTPHLTVVRARSERVLPDSGFQQIRDSSVVAAPRWTYVCGARDSFTVAVKDYEVTAVTPVPDWSAGETSTWLIRHEHPQRPPCQPQPSPPNATPEGGGQGQARATAEEDEAGEDGGDEQGGDEGDGDAGGGDDSGDAVKSSPQDVIVRLSYSPFGSAKNFLRLSRLSPFEVVPDSFDLSRFGGRVWELHGGETWVNLAMSLLFIIPVVWALVVFRRSRRTSRVLYFLLAAALLSSVLLCANSVSDAIYYNLYDGSAGADVNPPPEARAGGEAETPERQATDLIFMLPAVALVPLALLIPLAVAWLLLPSGPGARSRRRLRALAAPFAGACLAAAVALALLGLLGVLSVRPFSAVSPALVTTILGAAFFVLLYLLLGAAVAGQILKEFLRSRPRREWVSVLVVAVVLAHPDPLGLLPAPAQASHVAVLYYLRSFFSIVTTLTPYALLLPLLALLRRRGGDSQPPALSLGFILFAGYVVGSTANWFLIPVPFLLALWVFPRFVLLPPHVRRAVDAAREHVVAERSAILARVLSAEARATVRATLKKLREKLDEGDVSADEFEQRLADVEKLVPAGAEGNTLPGGLDDRRFVLGFGPSRTKWEDGVWAAKVGIILALPFLVINVWELIRTAGQRPHAHLYLLALAAVNAAGWLASAFFFGYFFSYLRGATGLKKGVHVSLAVVSCLLPVWLLTLPDPPVLLLRAGQTFIFFALLGLCAFDYYTLREKLGERFEWRNLLDAQDAPSLTTFASVLLASAGVTVNSVLTGEFKGVLTQMVEVTLQQVPGLLWKL